MGLNVLLDLASRALKDQVENYRHKRSKAPDVTRIQSQLWGPQSSGVTLFVKNKNRLIKGWNMLSRPVW